MIFRFSNQVARFLYELEPRAREQFRGAFRDQLVDTRRFLAEQEDPGRLARVRSNHVAYGRRRR